MDKLRPYQVESIDLIRKEFGGRLTPIKENGLLYGRKAYLCICDCGKQTTICLSHLVNGSIRSCGCLKKEKTILRNTTHGASKYNKSEYKTWIEMRRRCKNKDSQAYKNYGGRGITVCDRWNDFSKFLADMGPRPIGFEIDRIDNNGNYEPSNCHWVPREINQLNKRNSHLITAFGKTLNMSVWSNNSGIPYNVILNRIKRGWHPEKAVTCSVRIRKKQST